MRRDGQERLEGKANVGALNRPHAVGNDIETLQSENMIEPDCPGILHGGAQHTAERTKLPIFKADRTKVTIQDVIAVEGARLPDVDHAQKKFNTGMVVIVENGAKPSMELIERTNRVREQWIDYWTTTTGHRASMTTNPK